MKNKLIMDMQSGGGGKVTFTFDGLIVTLLFDSIYLL